MPEPRSYGDILRSERELAGYDIAYMSDRLHIRPDILSAIEESDFDRMPARGYCKNMIRAYARALNLDERRICNLYLDEVNDYELGSLAGGSSRQRGRQGSSSRSVRAQGGGDRSSASSGRPARNRPGDARQRSQRDSGGARRQGSSSQSIDARERRRQSDPASGRSRSSQRGTSRSGSSNRQARGARSSASTGIGAFVSSIGPSRSRQEGRVPRSFSTIGSTPPYARSDRGTRGSGGIAGMNMTLLLAIVAVAIIVIIVVVLFVNGGKQASQEVPSIPISGLTDTSSPEDDNQVSQVDVMPTDVKVQYSVASGQDAWMEVYENGSQEPTFAGVVAGPQTERYDVTGTITIRTANPDAVTVTADGEAVNLTKGSDSNYYSCTIDFAEVLRDWNAQHNGSSSSASSSSTQTQASSSSSASSSAGQVA